MPAEDEPSTTEFEQRSRWYSRTRDERQGIRIGMPIGGAGTSYLEDEVRSNYIAGSFLSTIITGCCVIESMLYDQVCRCDTSRLNEQHTLHGVLDLAMKYDVISKDVTDAFRSLDEINELRNSVVHYRRGTEDDAFIAQDYNRRLIKHFENIEVGEEQAAEELNIVNEYGKDHAEKILKAMFDIKAKCFENSMKSLHHRGPLVQGIDTVTSGEETYCEHCGVSIQDRTIEYDADWNGDQVINESAECPDCGKNTISTLRDSWLSPDDLSLDYT